MATLNSFLSSSSSSSSSLFLPRLRYHTYPHHPHPSLSSSFSPIINHRKLPTLVLASSSSSSSSSSSDNDNDDHHLSNLEDTHSSINPPKKSVLSALIQDIEPFDISIIQRDVPPATIDAMKRTISGMLGLLPSGQFQVHIEALWEPLSKLLISSMMTGYTLRNAEYRLCLERNQDTYEANSVGRTAGTSELDVPEILLDSAKKINFSGRKDFSKNHTKEVDKIDDKVDIQGLGEVSLEAQEYILRLQSHLSSAKRELNEVKRQSAALQMQQFVGEEKNDLLDYLRSLQPEKVAELSEPTSPELKETIHSVVHGLLATLSPRMHSKPPPSEKTSPTSSNVGEDRPELVENASLQFQPLVSLTRDYLARLLFWCMLLGHYLRGLEYRVELTGLLSLTANAEDDGAGGEQSA